MFQHQRHRKSHHHPDYQRNTKHLTLTNATRGRLDQEEDADTFEKTYDADFCACGGDSSECFKHDDRHGVIKKTLSKDDGEEFGIHFISIEYCDDSDRVGRG